MRWYAFIALLSSAFLFLFSGPSFADGINLPAVFVLGIRYFIPITLFVIFTEGFVLSKLLKTAFLATLEFSFSANVLSALAGIPILILQAWISDRFMPGDLRAYFYSYWKFSMVIYLLYFSSTVLIEWLWGLRWKKLKSLKFSNKALFFSILAANLFTYAFLVPLHYVKSKPNTNVRQFTENTGWAISPPAAILYIDAKTHHLMRILSDGSNKEELVPYSMNDYLISPDMKFYLYRGTDRILYHYDATKKIRKKIWEIKQRFWLNQIALSPSGRRFAYLSKYKPGPFRLFLYNIETERIVPLKYNLIEHFMPEIAWSDKENTIYIRKSKMEKIILSADRISSVERNIPVDSISLTRNYGFYGNSIWSSGSYWGDLNETDEYRNMFISSRFGIGISENNKILLKLWNFSQRLFDNPSFIQEGRECIFEERDHALYLADIPGRRVGKITDGYKHIVLTEKYRADHYFLRRLRVK